MHGWMDKKGLQASYLGLPSCFYDTVTNQVCHVMLNLIKVPHPHTGEILASEISKCLTHWNLPVSKVVIVITNNGSNMVKAINILQTKEKKKTEQSGEAGCSDRVDDITQMDECSDAESEESYMIQKMKMIKLVWMLLILNFQIVYLTEECLTWFIRYSC